MTAFADSSAVVKLYVEETASADIRALEAMYVADITRVEVPAALWRKTRTGDLGVDDCSILIQRFEDDVGLPSGRIAPIEITRDVLTRAASLTAAHALRAYDAVQLSVAIGVAQADPSCRTFVSFDRRLNDAAGREGFDVPF